MGAKGSWRLNKWYGNKMRHNFRLVILVILGIANLVSTSPSYAVEKEYQHFIERFKNDVKIRNSENMSTYISFPFSRTYPVPDIRSKEELKKRFDEVFDDELTELIVNSDVEKDWNSMGWRGMMLNNGIVWLDYDGRLMTINHQSSAEESLINNLINEDKNSLHKSLKKYENPVFTWETTKFKIRLDNIANYKYRYASWSKEKKYRDKPDIVLSNGVIEFEGSGGNHTYSFKHGKYTYKLYINRMRNNETPEGELRIFENDIEILHDVVIESDE